jgi:hypothetical protein
MVEVWEFGRMLAPPQPTSAITPVNKKDRNNLLFMYRSAFCIQRTPAAYAHDYFANIFATAVNSGDAKALSLHICNDYKLTQICKT